MWADGQYGLCYLSKSKPIFDLQRFAHRIYVPPSRKSEAPLKTSRNLELNFCTFFFRPSHPPSSYPSNCLYNTRAIEGCFHFHFYCQHSHYLLINVFFVELMSVFRRTFCNLWFARDQVVFLFFRDLLIHFRWFNWLICPHSFV